MPAKISEAQFCAKVDSRVFALQAQLLEKHKKKYKLVPMPKALPA